MVSFPFRSIATTSSPKLLFFPPLLLLLLFFKTFVCLYGCTLGSGHSMGSRYGWFKRVHEQIWGFGGLHCHEGLLEFTSFIGLVIL